MSKKRIYRKTNKDKRIIETARIIRKENPDQPLKFIIGTLKAIAEIEKGLGEEYQFGIIK